MTKYEIDKMIKSISVEYKVIVVYESSFKKDYGECYPEIDKIVLGTRYSSGKIKFAVFLHELGHILTLRRNGQRYFAASVFLEEAAVWTLAQELHYEYTGKPFSQGQGKFLVRCLDTYARYSSCFKKKFNK